MSDNTGLLSPSPQNYTVGKGFIIFRPAGEEDFFHLGNVPNFVFTPAVEKLDHYSSMSGTKVKDAIIVLQKTGTVKITMEEITKRNLGIMLMGNVDDTDPNNIVIDVFAQSAITGELRFYATNEVGPRWRLFLNQVQFTPNGDFSPISDNLMTLVVQGDVYAVDGEWGKAYLVSGSTPENITLPFITGTVAEGQILTVSNGGWIDVDTFSYQWKRGGVAITGATEKTYTAATADHGTALTCDVTGTNDFGTLTVTSIATVDVTT